MHSKALIEAWVTLVVLSAATTAMTLIDASGTVRIAVAAGVLMLAGLKARVILGSYLQLRHSQFWTRAFDLAVGCFLLICFVVYMLGVDV